MTIYSGDELYDDDITSGAIPEVFADEPVFPAGERCVLGHPVWIGSGDPEEGYCDGRCEQYDEPIPEDFAEWAEGEDPDDIAGRRWSSIEDYDRMKDDRLTDEAERGRR